MPRPKGEKRPDQEERRDVQEDMARYVRRVVKRAVRSIVKRVWVEMPRIVGSEVCGESS